jgi:hypothetical protein
MLASCAVFALSAAGAPAWVAVAVLLAGAVLQVAGLAMGPAVRWAEKSNPSVAYAS